MTESSTNTTCCPKFNAEPWDDKELVWKDKLFVKDRVFSILHIPINFGAVMKRNMAKIEAAGAKPADTDLIIISNENSLWGADVYISVTKEMAGSNMAHFSGTFLSKVFEGSYQQMKNWVATMKVYVQSKNKQLKKLYFYYTTCPKCAKAYGKNYIVLLAQI